MCFTIVFGPFSGVLVSRVLGECVFDVFRVAPMRAECFSVLAKVWRGIGERGIICIIF